MYLIILYIHTNTVNANSTLESRLFLNIWDKLYCYTFLYDFQGYRVLSSMYIWTLEHTTSPTNLANELELWNYGIPWTNPSVFIRADVNEDRFSLQIGRQMLR